MRKPDWESENVKLYLGDSADFVSQFDELDVLVTDPPYGISYQHSGGMRNNWRGKRGKYFGRVPTVPIIGDDKPFDPSKLVEFFPNAIIWGADHVLSGLPDGGSLLCWDKRDETGPDDSFTDAEFAWCSRKVKRNVFRYLWKGLCCVKTGEDNGRRQHPTQKPIALMLWCLSHFPAGHRVVDLYMGSGTTGVACVRTGRPFVGFEIDSKHFVTAVRRIEAELRRCPLFEPVPEILRRTTKELFQ